MAIMYDSIQPSAIPTYAAAVAGYVDGNYAWSQADWDRFPRALKVKIAVFSRTNDGHVLDVEQGDATPDQAPGWVSRRRTQGVDPIVYCNLSTWANVITAFNDVRIPQPHYWIAHYDGNPLIPTGACAKQYDDPPNTGGNYDISSYNQEFINAITGGHVSSPLTPDQYQELGRVGAIYGWLDTVDYGNAPTNGEVNKFKQNLVAEFTQMNSAIAALSNLLTTSVQQIQAQITTLHVELDAIKAELDQIKPTISGTFTVTGSGTVS